MNPPADVSSGGSVVSAHTPRLVQFVGGDTHTAGFLRTGWQRKTIFLATSGKSFSRARLADLVGSSTFHGGSHTHVNSNLHCPSRKPLFTISPNPNLQVRKGKAGERERTNMLVYAFTASQAFRPTTRVVTRHVDEVASEHQNLDKYHDRSCLDFNST